MRGRLDPSLVGRCPECLARTERCFCARLVTTALPISVRVLSHHGERFSPSSSVRVLARVASPVELRYFGGPHDPPLGEDPPEGAGCAMLFPPEPGELTVDPSAVERLIVPDGSWAQAKRLVRRWPFLRALPRVRLGSAALEVRERGIRTPREAGELDSLSAVALFFQLRGDVAASAALWSAHRALLSARWAWADDPKPG